MRLIDADMLYEAKFQTIKGDSKEEMYRKGWNDAIEAIIENAETVEPEPKWIPVKWHEITDEEREREGYPKDWVVLLDCDLPDDEQEILVTSRYGTVEKDVCFLDGEAALDSGWSWIDDIIAWQPLPDPYREDGGSE